MRFVDIIEKKKRGYALSKEEIAHWINGYVSGEVLDYQVSALCMAIYFQGMNPSEIAWLSEAMLDSGDRIDLSSIHGRTCDKHSTGGVGDKTSLSLLPMVAACGGKVAKMSGRGLGHTGGTLDKVASIEGFQTGLTQQSFIAQINKIGLALISQTQSLVPADKYLYALRDVTATVDSIPLIASSIMSKKLAAGADSILLDVKFGAGAFMATPEDAEELAAVMIRIGQHFNKDTRAMITDMNQPLGNAIGNALEVKEAIATLQGKGPEDFTELCLTAGSIMLVQSQLARNEEEARTMLLHSIHTGAALAKLQELVQYQCGNVEQIIHPEQLPMAKEVIPLTARKSGYIHNLYAQRLGNLAMRLGAGRKNKEDEIDHAAGIVLNRKAKDKVQKGDILAYVHTNIPLDEDWITDFYQAYTISETEVEQQPLIYKIMQ